MPAAAEAYFALTAAIFIWDKHYSSARLLLNHIGKKKFEKESKFYLTAKSIRYKIVIIKLSGIR